MQPITKIHESFDVFNDCPTIKSISSTITTLFWDVINTGIAIATEFFAIGIYFPYLYLKGHSIPFNDYGLNPIRLTSEQASLPAVLFLHGDKHNQSGAIPLAQKIDEYRKKMDVESQASKIGPVFTINLNYDDDHPQIHKSQLIDRVAEIKTLYQEQTQDPTKPFQLILVGHSKGAMEAGDYAYRHLPQHPESEVEVTKVISLAGRLQCFLAGRRSCHSCLQEQVNAVYQAIKAHPEVELYTVVAGKDWIMHPDSSYIERHNEKCLYLENRSHLGVLCSSEALDQIVEWLR